MAAKRKTDDPPIPPPVPAKIGEDPEDLDTEERRRLANQRRRYVRRQKRRRNWLALVEERDPEKYAELVELRRLSPQKFRQALIRWTVAQGEYTDRPYTSRDRPPLLNLRYTSEDE